MAALKILLVSADQGRLEHSAALESEGYQVFWVREANQVGPALERHPDIALAVLDTTLPVAESVAAYQALHQPKAIPTLLLVDRGGKFGIEPQDTHGGDCDCYLIRPFTMEELILRVKALLVRAGHSVDLVSNPSPNGHKAKQLPAQGGRVIAIYSPKGGVGKTTIATQLAIALAKKGHKVALVDGDLMNGGAGDMLDLHPVTTIDDLLPAVETVDFDDLSRVLQTHSTGVSVLVAPRRPVDAERVPPALIARVLKLAKQAFEYTIVDTGANYDDNTLEILEQSDRILMVVTPEVAVLRNAAMFLEITEGLGYRDRVAVVVNRANTGVGLEQVEQVLEIPAFATIVSAGHMVVESGNAGQAWVITHKNTEAAQDIWRLAAAVDGTIIKTTAVVRPQVAQQRPWALTALLPRVAMLPLGFIGGLR